MPSAKLIIIVSSLILKCGGDGVKRFKCSTLNNDIKLHNIDKMTAPPDNQLFSLWLNTWAIPIHKTHFFFRLE